jgi:hypothetical protein
MNETASDSTQPPNAPTEPPGPPVAAGPRQRVSAHMKRLLKSVAAGAAVGTSACLVCDPAPPPPPDCAINMTDDDLARSISASARWTSVSGAPVITVGVVPYFGTSLQFSGPPTVQGGTLGSMVLTDRDLTFLVIPDEGVTRVQVVVPMSCDTFPVMLNLSLNVIGPREPGSFVPVQIGSP